MPGVTCRAVPLSESIIPPLHVRFSKVTVAVRSSSSVTPLPFLRCTTTLDVAEDEGLIGGRYGDADFGSNHVVAILISFIVLVGQYRE